MLEMLGVPAAMLPDAGSSRGPMAEAARGTLCGRALSRSARGIGDQQSALFGQRRVERRRTPRSPTAPARSCWRIPASARSRRTIG